MRLLKEKGGFALFDAILAVAVVVIALVSILVVYQRGIIVGTLVEKHEESVEIARIWMAKMRTCNGQLAYSDTEEFEDTRYYNLVNVWVDELKENQSTSSNTGESVNFTYTFEGPVKMPDGSIVALSDSIKGWNQLPIATNSNYYVESPGTPLRLKVKSKISENQYLIEASFDKSEKDQVFWTDFMPERRINLKIIPLITGANKTKTIHLVSYIYVRASLPIDYSYKAPNPNEGL